MTFMVLQSGKNGFLIFNEIDPKIQNNKVGCVVSMVIWSEFRMGQYRDDDHREHAAHFSLAINKYPPLQVSSVNSTRRMASF